MLDLFLLVFSIGVIFATLAHEPAVAFVFAICASCTFGIKLIKRI